MYEKNGEKYFIVDGHMHFWDASPANWVAGQEQFAIWHEVILPGKARC